VDAPLLDLPRDLIDRAAGLFKFLSKQSMFGGIDEQTFEMGCCFWYIDSSRAEALGFKARPLGETLSEALADLKKMGFYWGK
jgi:hypothetical protein